MNDLCNQMYQPGLGPVAVFAEFFKCLWMPQLEPELLHSGVEQIDFVAGHVEAVVFAASAAA